LLKRFTVETAARSEMVDITAQVEEVVSKAQTAGGICLVQSLHTTAGITVNENADPSVQTDILSQLGKIVPFEQAYRHAEGNSDAHIKASLVGFSQALFVDRGRLLLGTWQGIYLCEFDGPRRRHVVVKVVSDS
jgi:secondary thiamine-phosphate synthase enzyme